MSKECKLAEVIILNTYANDASGDWIKSIEKILEDSKGESIIKEYSFDSKSLIYAKICEEKIDKIKRLHPTLEIEENSRYSIEQNLR
jgi:hypothetical protein